MTLWMALQRLFQKLKWLNLDIVRIKLKTVCMAIATTPSRVLPLRYTSQAIIIDKLTQDGDETQDEAHDSTEEAVTNDMEDVLMA